MTFTVKYRAKDGSIAEEVIEAADRADCFSKCKSRGIAVVNVSVSGQGAGVRRGEGNLRVGDKRNYKLITVVAGLLLAGAGVYFWRGEKTVGHEKSSVIKTEKIRVKKSTPEKGLADKPVPDTAQQISDINLVESNETYKGIKVIRREFTTNQTVIVERIYTADGKRHRKTHYPKPIFANASDEYLSLIVGPVSEGAITPLPNLSNENLEEDFKEAIKKPITINNDDSDDIKELKMRVIQAREEMRFLLKNGWKFAEALNEQRNLITENLDIRANALNEFNSILEKDDLEGAQDYLKTINIALEQMGIKPLSTPEQLKEKE